MVIVDRGWAFEPFILARESLRFKILITSLLFSSMIGSDESTTNYPGKIPSGLDLPSDVDEKELGKEGSDSGFT
jgi:hypothetical protein